MNKAEINETGIYTSINECENIIHTMMGNHESFSGYSEDLIRFAKVIEYIELKSIILTRLILLLG